MNKPIRVAHIIGKLNAAGVEKVISNYYRNIDHTKYQFDFFVDEDSMYSPNKELINMGANYYYVPSCKKLISNIRVLKSYFNNNNYLIVHSSMNSLSIFSLYAAKRCEVPIRISHVHSTAGKGEIARNIIKNVLRLFSKKNVTHYCACSKYAGEWLFGKRLIDNNKVTIINNAINLDELKYDEQIRKEIRKKLKVEDKIVIGHIGRFVKQKNHLFLIDVFKKIHNINQQYLLLLIGVGELENTIKQKAEEYGLKDSVLFLGKRDDCNILYQAMDVFALPSNYEGLPLVGIEAQANGLPCVFSNTITKEAKINDNVYYLTLSADKWANKLISLSKSRSGINENRFKQFDIIAQSKKLEQFYDNCLEEKGLLNEKKDKSM